MPYDYGPPLTLRQKLLLLGDPQVGKTAIRETLTANFPRNYSVTLQPVTSVKSISLAGLNHINVGQNGQSQNQDINQLKSQSSDGNQPNVVVELYLYEPGSFCFLNGYKNTNSNGNSVTGDINNNNIDSTQSQSHDVNMGTATGNNQNQNQNNQNNQNQNPPPPNPQLMLQTATTNGNILQQHFQDVSCCVYVYDATKYSTFESLERWVGMGLGLKNGVLIGMKSNGGNSGGMSGEVGSSGGKQNQQVVPTDQAMQFAAQHNLQFFEIPQINQSQSQSSQAAQNSNNQNGNNQNQNNQSMNPNSNFNTLPFNTPFEFLAKRTYDDYEKRTQELIRMCGGHGGSMSSHQGNNNSSNHHNMGNIDITDSMGMALPIGINGSPLGSPIGNMGESPIGGMMGGNMDQYGQGQGGGNYDNNNYGGGQNNMNYGGGY